MRSRCAHRLSSIYTYVRSSLTNYCNSCFVRQLLFFVLFLFCHCGSSGQFANELCWLVAYALGGGYGVRCMFLLSLPYSFVRSSDFRNGCACRSLSFLRIPFLYFFLILAILLPPTEDYLLVHDTSFATRRSISLCMYSCLGKRGREERRRMMMMMPNSSLLLLSLSLPSA